MKNTLFKLVSLFVVLICFAVNADAQRLRSITGTNGQRIYAYGIDSVGDGKNSFYVWSDTCRMADDGFFYIVPDGVTEGCWMRMEPRTTKKFYTKGGLLSRNTSTFCDTFAINSATPTINLAPYMAQQGWNSFKIRAATGYRAGASATNSPQVSVSGITSNSLSFVVTQTNTATITLLGINVLSGLPLILAPDPQNIKLILDLEVW